ncbi:MAG: 50S ribosomal protein L21 [bacterium]|nr:50S ribosomal protein L21 [bacterium]
MTFAVIKTGGKQYIVREGDELSLEKLEGNAGDVVAFSEVLLIADEAGEKVTPGTPLVSGAKVEGKIMEQGKGKKIFIIKYKPKVHYRRKRGHRQLQTKVKIEKIVSN